MFLGWTKHLKDPQKKTEFENTIVAAKSVLSRARDLLQEEAAVTERSELDPKVFDNPNWAYRQAFKNGYLSGLNTAIKLVDLDQQKVNK